MHQGSLRQDLLKAGIAKHRLFVDAPTLHALQKELSTVVEDFYAGVRGGPDFWSYPSPDGSDAPPVLFRIHNLDKQIGLPCVQALIEGENLKGLAADAVGGEAVRTVCAAIVKIPLIGSTVPWHRDRVADVVAPGKMVNLSLYLADAEESNGCLHVIPGSHRQPGNLSVEDLRQEQPILNVTASAGDVVLHDVRLAHDSGGNSSADLVIRIVVEYASTDIPFHEVLRPDDMDLKLSEVCMVAPPFFVGHGWVTVPPAGYGGIQWSMAHLIDGLRELGVKVTLLGAPGSQWPPDVQVVDVVGESDIVRWLQEHRPPLIHDFANFSRFDQEVPVGSAYCRTWQLTSIPEGRGSTVYVSVAQRDSVGGGEDPTIPISVDLARYPFESEKGGYFLFLGRVSPWKGAYEAAALASRIGAPLIIAGPSWEPEYLTEILETFQDAFYVGEVGGHERLRLLARARALMVLSQPVAGPWGQIWCEPGAAVVSEASACGTPVIATANGCLGELVPGVGALVSSGSDFTAADIEGCVTLPAPVDVRRIAEERWSSRTLAQEYVSLYQRVIRDRRWR